MKPFAALVVRPYQLLCLVCRQGCCDRAEGYCHGARLDEIQAAVQANPALPLTLRCHTATVFQFQNPGREYDTPEGELYNDLRDLTVLQRLGLVPGATLPAIDLFTRLYETVPTNRGICGYAEEDSPGWPRCSLADSGNYERGIAQGCAALVPERSAEERGAVKAESVRVCEGIGRLRIRPHHLLCLTCFHARRPAEAVLPIPEDNLAECIRRMQGEPDVPVELVHGPCLVCPPCRRYHPESNLCLGGRSMGLRDDKKDLDTLRRLGLGYGAVLPARELLRRLYRAIASTTDICGYGDGEARSPEWSVCGGPTGNPAYLRGRAAGLGVDGVAGADE